MTIERKLRDGGLSTADVVDLKRRLFLRQGLSLSALTLLGGCDVTDSGPVDGVLRLISGLNDRVQGALFRSTKLARTFPESMVPAEFRKSGLNSYTAGGATWSDAARAFRADEFILDPTRLTLMCGTAGYDGTQFKNLLANEYEIQLNKTSRNSILLQTNINNTRSDVANLLKVLVEISKEIEGRLKSGGEEARKAFAARVKSLVEDVPDLPNFSRFHDAFRDNAKSKTSEGHMRAAYYMAYDASASA